jgi:hypothetical protein
MSMVSKKQHRIRHVTEADPDALHQTNSSVEVKLSIGEKKPAQQLKTITLVKAIKIETAKSGPRKDWLAGS